MFLALVSISICYADRLESAGWGGCLRRQTSLGETRQYITSITRFLEVLPKIWVFCSRILGFYASRYPAHLGLPKLHGVTQNMLVRRSNTDLLVLLQQIDRDKLLGDCAVKKGGGKAKGKGKGKGKAKGNVACWKCSSLLLAIHTVSYYLTKRVVAVAEDDGIDETASIIKIFNIIHPQLLSLLTSIVEKRAAASELNSKESFHM